MFNILAISNVEAAQQCSEFAYISAGILAVVIAGLTVKFGFSYKGLAALKETRTLLCLSGVSLVLLFGVTAIQQFIINQNVGVLDSDEIVEKATVIAILPKLVSFVFGLMTLLKCRLLKAFFLGNIIIIGAISCVALLFGMWFLGILIGSGGPLVLMNLSIVAVIIVWLISLIKLLICEKVPLPVNVPIHIDNDTSAEIGDTTGRDKNTSKGDDKKLPDDDIPDDVKEIVPPIPPVKPSKDLSDKPKKEDKPKEKKERWTGVELALQGDIGLEEFAPSSGFSIVGKSRYMRMHSQGAMADNRQFTLRTPDGNGNKWMLTPSKSSVNKVLVNMVVVEEFAFLNAGDEISLLPKGEEDMSKAFACLRVLKRVTMITKIN